MKLSAQHFKVILSQKKSSKGFTLIELLVVIGILAVLLAITLIAINPARQFEQANNTQRSSDVNAILNAVWQFGVDNNGNLTTLNIPVGVANSVELSTAGLDICDELAEDYIAQLPFDPTDGDPDTAADGVVACSDYATGYHIYQTAAGRVTVTAPSTEPVDADATNDITVTR